jgi:hypothetical protein
MAKKQCFWCPTMSDEKDMIKVKDVYYRASNNILFATVAMGILIALNLDNAVAILPPAYSALKPLVLIM